MILYRLKGFGLRLTAKIVLGGVGVGAAIVLAGVGLGWLGWEGRLAAEATAKPVRACVSPHYDKICLDVPARQIYELARDGMIRTDDKARFSAFNNVFSKDFGDRSSARYSVQYGFFFRNKNPGPPIISMGFAGLCDNGPEPITRETRCRNRNYYFYDRAPAPEAAAALMIKDMQSTHPTLPACRGKWSSGAPKPPPPCSDRPSNGIGSEAR